LLYPQPDLLYRKFFWPVRFWFARFNAAEQTATNAKQDAMIKNLSASSGSRQQGNFRVIVMVVLGLAIGFAGGALVVYQSTKAKAPGPIKEPAVVLSGSTKAVLRQVTAPVEVRFYSLFGAENASEDLRGLMVNVNELLAEFEREADGKLAVTRFNEWTAANTEAAAADGVAAFNLDKGDPAYVGLVVSQDERKEAIAQIAPEWVEAVEYDLARMIWRVSNPPPAPRTPADRIQTEKAEAVIKQTIPNPATTSLEDGKQLLREISLRNYQALVEEMNREGQQAEQLVKAAGSDADRRAAVHKLQAVRAAYADKLRLTALRSQAELEAWTKLKSQ
jgi:hypothetical protein